MSNGQGGKKKYIDSSDFRRSVAVFACHSDVCHSVVLGLAKGSGVLSESRYEALVSVPHSKDRVLTSDELSKILESYFGFDRGDYEEHHIEGWQTSKFSGKVVGEVRYTGSEREDDDWVATGLASPEVVEKLKFGSEVKMEDKLGYGEMVLDDNRGHRGSDY